MPIKDMNKLPVNTPFYWSVIKSSFDKESAFVSAGNLLLNDILESIIAEQDSIDPRTAGITSPVSMRFATIGRLKNVDVESELLDIDREYLIKNSILMKHYEDISGVPTFLGSFDLFCEDTRSISKITDRYYAPDTILINGIDYMCTTQQIRFDVDPITALLSAEESSITCPSSKSYEVTYGSYIFQQVEKKDGPLYRDFGTLVYHRDINDIETELEYRRKIVGLMLAYYHGSTLVAIEAAANTLLGLPVTLYDNEVIVSVAETIPTTVVRTDKETYVLDNTLPINREILQQGASLKAYTPFHQIVTIEKGVGPAVLPEKIFRVNPYGKLTTATAAEVFTAELHEGNMVPLHYKYTMLKSYAGTAVDSSALNLVTTPRTPGDYVLVQPSAPGMSTITVTYLIEHGGDQKIYVEGDILYVDPTGFRWRRYRDLIYKGEVSTDLPDVVSYPLHREEYHVFKVAAASSPIEYVDFDGATAYFAVGDYMVRDDFSEAFFPLGAIDITPPTPCDLTRQITFDFFQKDVGAVYKVFTDTVPITYKVLSDRVEIKEYNTYVWEKLIKESYLTVKIVIPAAGIHLVSDLSFLKEIMPLWAIYSIEYKLSLSDTISPEDFISDSIVIL